jgi:hypothetical protein
VRRSGILLTGITAWVGVVLGHLAAYVLAYPSAGRRHIHLAVSGHDWVGVATASLMAAIPVILLLATLLAVSPREFWSGGGLSVRLAAIQVPAFALIELLERGWSFDRTVGDPAVFVGLALQPIVAVLAAWVLDLFRRTVRAVIARRRLPRPRAPRSYPRPAVRQAPPRHQLLLPTRRRAPPVVAAA